MGEGEVGRRKAEVLAPGRREGGKSRLYVNHLEAIS